MHSKVSSDWLPRYSKATQPVLEILKKAGYFLDSPRICQQEQYIIRRWGITDLVDSSISYRDWDFSFLPSVVLEVDVLMWNRTTFSCVLLSSKHMIALNLRS